MSEQTEKDIAQNEVSDFSDNESENIGITFVPNDPSLSITGELQRENKLISYEIERSKCWRTICISLESVKLTRSRVIKL